jgi:excisionase family DNA binding protein
MQHVYFTPTTRTLLGLDQIAAYLQVHRRTAWRWVHEYGLPAMQPPAGTWLTTTSLVDLWILACANTRTHPRVVENLGQGRAEGLDEL